jgi:hypothetical protein
MGRSGTSALTRVLSLCGASLPSKIIQPNFGNPTGYWEPESALAINDAFLHGHSTSWYDPTLRLQFGDVVVAAERRAYVENIASFLSSQEAGLLVVKDPRISGVASYWLESAREFGFDIGCAIAVRHYDDVAQSLARRDGLSNDLSSLLWLKYNLLSESASRSWPRIFVPYGGLIRDWRTQVRRISAALEIDVCRADEGAIDGFLDPALDHASEHPQGAGEYLPFMESVFSTLSSACLDREFDVTDLDAALLAYRAADVDFRASTGGSFPLPVGDSIDEWDAIGRGLASTYRSAMTDRGRLRMPADER